METQLLLNERGLNVTFSEGGFEFHNSFLRAHCGG